MVKTTRFWKLQLRTPVCVAHNNYGGYSLGKKKKVAQPVGTRVSVMDNLRTYVAINNMTKQDPGRNKYLYRQNVGIAYPFGEY